MCKCIEKLEKGWIGQITARSKRKVVAAEIEAYQMYNSSARRYRLGTKSNVTLVVGGLKKPIKTFIIHSYCPFCGQKHNNHPNEDR